MRERIQGQSPLWPATIEHVHADELRAISDVLDEHPELLELVEMELVEEGAVDVTKGRRGMTAEQVLRAAIAQQLRQWTFEMLAWNLADSQSYRAFCRLGAFDRPPKKSTLQENIRKVSDHAWDAIHRILIWAARDEGLEKGRKVRIDCTSTKADVAPPSDSKLCVDVIRVGNRLLERLPEEVTIAWSNHHRRAKKRASAIRHTRKKTRRKKLYQDLLTVMNKHIGYLLCAVEALLDHQDSPSPPADETTLSDLIALIAKAQQVMDQTTRRVIDGKKVPANEKIVSIFEDHADILTKRGGTVYGHKICLTVGASSLVLDVAVEEGNPADSTLTTNMIARQNDLYGRVPRQAAFDGGFASKANLNELKEMGVKDVAFNKKRGLKVSDMVRSSWVYKQLYRFRAGVEGVISWLKRCFGLRRCRWRSGFASFRAYVRSAVVAANLLTMARLRLQQKGG